MKSSVPFSRCSFGGFTDRDIKRELIRICLEHGLKDRDILVVRNSEELEIPSIICSKALQ